MQNTATSAKATSAKATSAKATSAKAKDTSAPDTSAKAKDTSAPDTSAKATSAPATSAKATSAPATTQVQAPVTVPATVQAVPVTYAGLPWASLTKSQQATALAKGGVHLSPALQAAPGLTLGPVAYKVRSGNNAAWWAICQQALAAGNGQASAASMVQAGACPKFVGYAVARKWLASAKATA